MEAREGLIARKRNDFVRKNKLNNEYMPDFFVELANEDIMELDDDTKEAFDTPSLPENFNKREVNLMIEKIDEESIFKATLISL